MQKPFADNHLALPGRIGLTKWSEMAQRSLGGGEFGAPCRRLRCNAPPRGFLFHPRIDFSPKFNTMKSWLLSLALLAGLAIPPATQAQAQAGVTDNEILLGQSAALTGPAAELGKQMRAGAEAYFKIVNDQGGIFGRRIRLLSLDDGYEPERAAANTQRLIEQERVFALFGFVGTPTSNAAKPIFTAARVPFFAPFTGAESMRNPVNRYIFNVRGSYLAETEAIVNFLDTPRVKNIAVFYQNDAYGQAGLDGVVRALAKFNAKPVALGTVERNSTDVAAAVAAISKVRPEAVVMVSAYKSSAAFIRAMKPYAAAGTTFWNVSFVGSRALADELGDDGRGVGISQVVPFPWDSVRPVTKEHQSLLGSGLSFTTLEGFIAAKVLVEGLRKAGKALTREALVTALESGKIDVGGFAVQYAPDNHDGSRFVDLTMIARNGKFIR